MAKLKERVELSPKKREEIRVAREKKLTEASARLANGVEAVLKGERWKEYLKFSLKFPQYSFVNMPEKEARGNFFPPNRGGATH